MLKDIDITRSNALQPDFPPVDAGVAFEQERSNAMATSDEEFEVSDKRQQREEPNRDLDELEVGDWVMQRSRPELGLAVVTNVMHYCAGSRIWQVVSTDEPTWRGTLSQCLEKVGPPKSRRRQ
jgi:hypothetical protein